MLAWVGLDRRQRIGAALLIGIVSASSPTTAAELCRYAGATSHAGRVVVETRAISDGGAVTVDVTLAFTLATWLFDARYLRQEISTWRAGELQSVAINARDSVDGRMVRQQWDVFQRSAGRFEARRVQAKTLAAFRRRHPSFVGHWPSAAFGQAWLQDYAAAKPERRPDLDLLGSAPPGLRTPLALTFYWSRFLPPEGGAVPVFLPGFKQHARAELRFAPAIPGGGWRRWDARVRNPALSDASPTMVEAWVSPDHHLLQLAFDAHARAGSASGLIRSQGCDGS